MISSRPLSFILTVAAIALMGERPNAQTLAPDKACLVKPGQMDSCVPIVACLIGEDVYFVGQALGWNSGTFAGRTNAGFSCYGTWTARNIANVGQAELECDNGRTGGALFVSQDNMTGTATGHGTMSNGTGLQMWSGRNIQQFIINQTGNVNARLMCGEVEIPLG